MAELNSSTCSHCGGVMCKCGTCHNCASSGVYTAAVTSPPVVVPVTMATKSQKVRGIRALRNSGLGSNTVPIRGHITKDSDLTALGNQTYEWPMFARPCPVTPKHGFVDSRPVKDWESVLKVWAETLAADPDGELLLMPVIPASHNAIWTPTLVTIGKGHDGATAGKETFTFPLIGIVPDDIKALLEPAGVTAPDAPYIEAVWHKGLSSSAKLTQLRAGPHIEGTGPDYVPSLTTVEQILRPNGEDLIKWAEKIEQAPFGTVVYHPGGSPADHYFVHARLSKVPVVTSFEPKVGDTLEPTPPAEDPDPQAVLRGVIDADTYPLKGADLTRLIPLMLTALHHEAAMTGAHGRWVGFAAGIMLRAGSLALRGEARHRIVEAGKSASKEARDAIYARMANRSLSFHRAGLNRLAITFQYGQWSGKGYGGPKWAKCAKSLQGLFDGVRQLALNPTTDSVAALTKALNIAVNQAHNGGWWLNKFVSSETFDTIQDGSLIPTLQATKAAYEVWARPPVSAQQVERYSAKYAAWPETEIRVPKLDAVEITSLPGAGGLVLSIRSRLLGKHLRSIPITLERLNSMLETAVSNTRMQESPGGGLKLVADISSMNAVLWETPAITLEAD